MRAVPRPAATVLAVVAVLVLALDAAAGARAHPGLALGDPSAWALAVQVVAAVGAVGAGALVLAGPRARCSGVLLMLAGPAAALAMVPGPATRSGVLFTAALAFGGIAPALVGAAAAAYPSDSPAPGWRWPVAVVLALSVGVGGVGRAALFDPAAAGCFGCPRNLLDVGAGPGAFATVDGWGSRLALAWSALVFAVVAVRRLRAVAGVRRRTVAVVAAAGVVGLTLIGAAEAVLTAAEPFDRVARLVWLVQCGLIVLTATLIAAEALGVRWVAQRMAELALREDTDATAVTDGIAAAAGAAAGEAPSPVLVAFARDAAGAVDVHGHAAPKLPAGWELVALRRSGAVTVEVRYPSAYAGVAHRVVAASTAAALALERIGASARLQAELAELASSRVRIMEAADAERRRLERDLHDGAQQRLIALTMLTRMAARRAAADDAGAADALDEAAESVSTALAELRRLARGIYPVTLSDLDLGAALRSLAGSGDAPLTVTTELAGTPSPAVARTIYQLVARSLVEVGSGPGDGGRAGVVAAATQAGPDIRVLVTARLEALAADRVHAAVDDRVAALGGTLSRSSDRERTTFDLVLPCGS